MKPEQLLAEVEDLLRATPTHQEFEEGAENLLSWLGRAAALIEQWNSAKGLIFALDVRSLHHPLYDTGARKKLLTLLHQARHDLRMKTIGPLSVAIPKGMVFDYFDEIRKVLEEARQDVFFIDPYLDAEFVSRYLAHVGSGASIRLLARERLGTLLPSVHAFIKQSRVKVEVRSASGFHDRYLFIDQRACYQSGSSFKDGAKSAPTTLTQIIDAFSAMQRTYEDIWRKAKVEL